MKRFSDFFAIFYKFDWVLVTAVVFLIVFGLAAIYSVALGRGTGEFWNFYKQLIWVGLSFLALIICANIDYHFWQKISWPAYAFAVLLLALVLTPLGTTINGTRGWFSLGFFSFQPVELAKAILIIVLANLAAKYSRTIHKLGEVIIIGIVALIPFALVLLNPDFGSAMVLFLLWLFSFLLINKNKWHLLIICLIILALALTAWFVVLHDFQKARVMTFVNPSLDPLGRGYNVKQSIIAVGAGQLLGKGLGFGSQSQLKFIPESQTDFIFAVIAEELGFIGVALILAFFSLLLYRLYRIAARAPDDFGLFLVLLCAGLIFIHLFINIGMCVGLLPVTGIPLPFISYGGSFLLTVMILMGIILNVYKSSIISRKF